MTYRKKLIEVALPLDAINRASDVENLPFIKGHPKALHKWWARRTLAACRAVLFASIVDDPGNHLPELEAAKERERLFKIIEELVKWENSTNETVLTMAKEEINKSTSGKPPPVLDPFCGGGSIASEAQRLGLDVYTADLNPVSALITKALVELPARYAGNTPVHPRTTNDFLHITNVKNGLVEDVLWYGEWVAIEAEKRLKELYPLAPNGRKVLAWLWSRTVKCPSPACGAQMPLVRSFWLSRKPGAEAYLEPLIQQDGKTISFVVNTSGRGAPKEGTIGNRTIRCVYCGNSHSQSYLHSAEAQRTMDTIPLAMVVAAERGRSFMEVPFSHISAANVKSVTNEFLELDLELAQASQYMGPPLYGLKRVRDLFTPRQLLSLTELSLLTMEAGEMAFDNSHKNRLYADALVTYLALAVSRLTDYCNALCKWDPKSLMIRRLFDGSNMPMAWDFVETNPLQGIVKFRTALNWVTGCLENLSPTTSKVVVEQLDAMEALPQTTEAPLVSTDPPYYGNVPYADLSDFFYVWLRKMLSKAYPSLFSTIATPKRTELIASPYRFEGDKQSAEQFFETGMLKALQRVRAQTNPDYPMTVYYAYKQMGEEGTSTGWATMLQSLLEAGFQITGTWPMETEQKSRRRARDANALASSIILVCRPRAVDAPIATRREFLSVLRKELPEELKVLMNGRVAPVDLAQASIGPGMAVFSRYSKVLDADGSAMTVRTALQEINYFLEDYLAQQEGDLDVESQFCVAWFQQYGTKEGLFGEADVLARAKNISVEGLTRMGLVEASRGKVRLTFRENYGGSWDPQTQPRLSAWEACQRLVWTLNEDGEQDAGRLARRLGGKADQARELAYRLYDIADRKGWAEEAFGYNALVASWPEIQKAAAEAAEETQGRMV